MRILLLVILSLSPPLAGAVDDLTMNGDLRGGLVGAEVRGRDGAVSDAASWRLRARAGLSGALSDRLSFGVRLAGRFDTEQRDVGFWFHGHAPSPGGLDLGQATFDQLYLEFGSADRPWSLRAGRFQTAFELAGVAKKSLDRLDSPSFDVSWTDGLWLRRRAGGWTAHAILQHNDDRGPSNTLRPPLHFTDGASRVGLFVGMEATAPSGPLVQRMVSLTWLPSALRPLGPGNAAREDYLALTARTAAEWPLGEAGRKLLVGAEVGWAPNTPSQSIVGSGNRDAAGLAWQASVNFVDLLPRHSLGVVYGRASDGWLVSPDFRPNEWALEARWAWRLRPRWTLEARLRRRQDLDLPFASLYPRRSDDFYLRATYRH